MKNIFNKKIIIIFVITLSIMLVISSVLLYFFLKNQRLTFSLVGDEVVTLKVYQNYNDLGATVKVGNKDLSNQVVVDYSMIDITKLGKYEVKYKVNYDDKEYTFTRYVEVVDDEAPVITLNGDEEINIVVGNSYNDPEYNVVDNYDSKASNKILIDNKVNINQVGVYEVIYKVTDDSGNTATKIRRVNVLPNDNSITNVTDLMESNLTSDMKFIDNGIYLRGYLKNNNGSFKLKLCDKNKKNCTSYDLNKEDKYYYNGEVNLTSLKDGTYYMWISSVNDEKVVNKLEMQYQIVRAKLGDKLVTFSYDNNNVKVKIEKFEYKYDILIDPGHGGSDPGASNSIINEKALNLEQSLYEKKRYEEHGLKVLLLREDETYGITMGDSTWPAVRRKAYALGFYGVVSKVTYSNHHNSSDDLSISGWEIIIPASSTKEEMNDIYTVGDSWSKSYIKQEDHIRIYTRNYNTGSILTKEEDKKYDFTDYYAVIRIPYQLFNIKNVLYEGAYLSNERDFNWYYTDKNWIQMSEEKIKVYVEKLGKKYIAPQNI